MAYTPINWQTGDTITAEKMNKMDNGWGVQETQLFSETVTTTDLGGVNGGALSYSTLIDSASIVVTFNGTDYTCPRIEFYGTYYYGGFTEQGPDFSICPFALESSPQGNTLYTQSAGSYTVSATANSVEISENFSNAVNQCVDTSALPMLCVSGETTESEILTALSAKRLLYFYVMGDLFIIQNYSSAVNSFGTIPTSNILVTEINDGVFNAYYN